MLSWREIKSEHPEIGQVIILSNEKITDFRKWTLGQFLDNDEKTGFGVLITPSKIVKPEAFLFWAPFMHPDIGIPSDYKNEEIPTYLNAFKILLKSYEHRFLVMANSSKVLGSNLFYLDFYFHGVYSRTLSLLEGFTVLLESKNFMAASHLVRPYLDNFLRLFAAWLVKNPNEFANEIMKGKKVEDFFDKDNEKQALKDWYLRNKASESYPWITEVYKQTSGYIHFSSKHIYNPIVKVDAENATVGTYLTKYDSKTVTDLNRIEAVLVMIEISNCILDYAYGWARTKMH
jgi:hypothetical protein